MGGLRLLVLSVMFMNSFGFYMSGLESIDRYMKVGPNNWSFPRKYPFDFGEWRKNRGSGSGSGLVTEKEKGMIEKHLEANGLKEEDLGGKKGVWLVDCTYAHSL